MAKAKTTSNSRSAKTGKFVTEKYGVYPNKLTII